MKIKKLKKIEEPLFKPINLSIDDMLKFEEQKMIEKRLFEKNTWSDCSDSWINFISEPTKNRWLL